MLKKNMKTEKLYRILSAILMPITFILAFFTLPFALMSFGNPSTLLGLFIFICVIIYMVKSVGFYRKHILTELPAKASNREWIRINAIVAVVFVAEIFVSAYAVFFQPESILKAMQIFMNSLQDAEGGTSLPVTAAQMLGALRNLMIFFTIYGIIMLVHIFCSFKLLKKYRHLLTL